MMKMMQTANTNNYNWEKQKKTSLPLEKLFGAKSIINSASLCP